MQWKQTAVSCILKNVLALDIVSLAVMHVQSTSVACPVDLLLWAVLCSAPTSGMHFICLLPFYLLAWNHLSMLCEEMCHTILNCEKCAASVLCS